MPALLDAAAGQRPAPRSGGSLLKGGLLLMLLAASFAAGDYFASRPRAPELTRAAAALPRPAPAGEQHTFPNRPLPREAARPAPSGQVPAEFQKQLQQPPTVIPPPGQGAAVPAPGSSPGQAVGDRLTAGQEPIRSGGLSMAIAHRIVGPQEQYERTGAQNLRDIRPFTTRLSEGLRSSASGLVLGFQEVSGIWARLGEKTASLLGNANLTIAMRQDSGRTRDWIEKTAGQTYITQATAYHGASDGAYREARHAEVRPVSCIDWNDLTTLIEGEAISRYRRRCSTNEGRTPPAGLVGLGRIEKILRSKIRGGGT